MPILVCRRNNILIQAGDGASAELHVANSHVRTYKQPQSRPAGHAVAAFMLLLSAVSAKSIPPLRGREAAGAMGCPFLFGTGSWTASVFEESKMPKMKTKSGAKKRFKMTGTGKVKAAAAGKRHGMIKRTAKFVRDARGTMVLNDSDAKIVKKYMPYAR
jgi:large subunit ribosomal protein L35